MHFVLARDSRHRLACLALYRALLRQGERVPLPDAVRETAARTAQRPIRDLVRRQFVKNKAYTSPRLAYAGLSAGYKFLSLFARAQDPTSKDHESVVGFIQKQVEREATRQQRAAARLAAQPPRAKLGARPPLLTRVPPSPDDPPDAPPRYVSTVRPRPLFSLPGKRRIPRLCATARQVPFLRLSKPQSPRLSAMLRWRSLRYERDIILFGEFTEEHFREGADEDRWERILLGQAREEGARDLERELGREARKSTFGDAVQDVIDALRERMERQRMDGFARARALMEIVEREEEFAAIEEEHKVRGAGRGKRSGQ